MTSKQRISNILKRKPADRIGLCETFWSDTIARWTKEGRIEKNENLAEHFGHDIETCWVFDMKADLDYVPEVVEETKPQ